MKAAPDFAGGVFGAPGRRRRALFAALPVVAALTAVVISWPARAGFLSFLLNDAGSSLAATRLAVAGRLAMGFPYGPLTLGLQALALRGGAAHGALAMILLGAAGALGLGAVLAWGIGRLRLSGGWAVLLAAAGAYMAMIVPWVPVYALEPIPLALAVICAVGGGLEWGLAWCVVGALIKPSMAVVLGAWFLLGLVWRSVSRRSRLAPMPALLRALRPAVVTAACLLAALGVWCGPAGLLRLLSPLAGARNHQLMGFSFWHRADNPFFLPGMHPLRFLLGTPLLLWTAATLLLAVWLLAAGRGPAAGSPAWAGWFAAWGCCAATAVFVFGFYSWRYSYGEYFFLPFLGLAALSSHRRRASVAAAVLLGLAVLGAWTVVRSDLQLWLTERPRAVTASLWASSADAVAWQAFVTANPPATHPLFLLDAGAPEAFAPGYGPAWHGYAVAGEITAGEQRELARRLASSACVAYRPGRFALSAAQLAGVLARQPRHQVGDLFTTYGCAP